MDYLSLRFTSEFLASYRRLASSDQRRIDQALNQLEENERHPSLNVHQLKGQEAGVWVAYASRKLRITFERLDSGQKRLVECSQHYGD